MRGRGRRRPAHSAGRRRRVPYDALVDVLEPVVQPYAWGSRRAIAELRGRPVPSPGPEAELWMGAHPKAPSGLVRGERRTTLDKVIAADPAAELGAGCAARFGPRLPFLLKVLAPEQALSIQVHPDRAQAEAGYRAENERGIPPGDRARNYVDDWPKPELLCAVTPFEVLAGFRAAEDAAALLAGLDAAQLRPVAAGLATSGDRVGALRAMLGWPQEQRKELHEQVRHGCARLASGGGRYAAACDAVLRIAADHPADMGVVAALLLSYSVLAPGEALFMPAGGLHAYIKGVGVELLANSDNVLRAGLTPKHVDVPELLRLVDPSVAVPVIRPRRVSAATLAYDTPAPEFRLYRMRLTAQAAALPDDGPRIVLCLEGDAELRDTHGEPVTLRRGESCFVPASDGAITAAGPGTAFVAASTC
jgi:mannose-6-phosphate isomerase